VVVKFWDDGSCAAVSHHENQMAEGPHFLL
jgi:hypothetical protein